jgi:hypothetical protein
MQSKRALVQIALPLGPDLLCHELQARKDLTLIMFVNVRHLTSRNCAPDIRIFQKIHNKISWFLRAYTVDEMKTGSLFAVRPSRQ